jgi:hypothetical protein
MNSRVESEANIKKKMMKNWSYYSEEKKCNLWEKVGP